MKNIEIVNAVNALQKVKDKNLPIKISYTLAKASKTLETAFNVIEEERVKVVLKNVKKDENGRPIQVDGDRYELIDAAEFNSQIEELYNLDTELVIAKISADELMSIDCDKFDGFTMAEISALAFMIEE